jgi:allophanate hydrolase subunit 1
VAYANVALEENKKKFDDVADKLDQFKAGMDTLVDHAREVQLIFEQYQADPQALLDRLNEAGTNAVENLQKEFEKPLPEDMDERAKYRAEMIASILNHMEGPYVTASEELGIPEDKARQSFEAIRRALEDTLIIAGMSSPS